MLSRLLRQRRRILILAFGLAIAALLRGGAVHEVAAAALFGLVFGSAVTLVAPRAREALEALGLGLPVAASLPVEPTVFTGLALLVCIAMGILIHGTWSDRTPLRLAITSQRRARVALPPAEVWPRLVPGAGHPDDYWTGTLVDFDSDPDDPLTLYLRHERPDGLYDEATLSFLDSDAPRACAYMLETTTDTCQEEAEVHLTLTPETGGTLIEGTLRQEGLPPRLALGRWLDDSFGDEWDSLAATLGHRRDWSLHRRGSPARLPATAEIS